MTKHIHMTTRTMSIMDDDEVAAHEEEIQASNKRAFAAFCVAALAFLLFWSLL